MERNSSSDYIPPVPAPNRRQASAADAFLDGAKSALEDADYDPQAQEEFLAKAEAYALVSIAASLIAITDKMYE